MGDGSRVSFWTDIWCGDWSLDSRFPILFGLVVDKDAAVVDYMEGVRSLIFWNVRLHRSLQDWELCDGAFGFALWVTRVRCGGGCDVVVRDW